MTEFSFFTQVFRLLLYIYTKFSKFLINILYKNILYKMKKHIDNTIKLINTIKHY